MSIIDDGHELDRNLEEQSRQVWAYQLPYGATGWLVAQAYGCQNGSHWSDTKGTSGLSPCEGSSTVLCSGVDPCKGSSLLPPNWKIATWSRKNNHNRFSVPYRKTLQFNLWMSNSCGFLQPQIIDNRDNFQNYGTCIEMGTKCLWIFGCFLSH